MSGVFSTAFGSVAGLAAAGEFGFATIVSVAGESVATALGAAAGFVSPADWAAGNAGFVFVSLCVQPLSSIETTTIHSVSSVNVNEVRLSMTSSILRNGNRSVTAQNRLAGSREYIRAAGVAQERGRWCRQAVQAKQVPRLKLGTDRGIAKFEPNYVSDTIVGRPRRGQSCSQGPRGPGKEAMKSWEAPEGRHSIGRRSMSPIRGQ